MDPAYRACNFGAPSVAVTRWAILTGEYPPDLGGVSDYTRLVAHGLVAAGDEVRVFAPPARAGMSTTDPGVAVDRLSGRFGPRSLAELEQHLIRHPRPDRVLVQYVPHAFGFKAMNVLFAEWVALRLRRIAPVWVTFHEVVFPFRWRPFTDAILGSVTRLMARLVAGAAERVFVTIPAWGTVVKSVCPRAKPAEWLPVPCTLDTTTNPAAVTAARDRFVRQHGFLVGHFGTFGGLIVELLLPAATLLLKSVPSAALLLVGRGSESFRDRFVTAFPEFGTRVHAMGEVLPADVSAYLRACDLLIQPYPDGISSRRTSAMAGLANGLPIVTNLGALSEPLWAGDAVAAVPSPDSTAMANRAAQLLANPAARAELGRRALALYREKFALEHTIARLRGKAP